VAIVVATDSTSIFVLAASARNSLQTEVGMVSGEDIAGTNVGLEYFFPECAGVEVHSSPASAGVEPAQHGTIIREVLHDAQNDDRIIRFRRGVLQEVPVQHLAGKPSFLDQFRIYASDGGKWSAR